MGLRKRLSYETGFRMKAMALALVFGIGIFMLVYYPLISHQTNPFGVAAPKGQVLLAQNVSIGPVNYTNAVLFTSKNNALVLKGNDDMGETLTLTVTSPGWCVDLWVWAGSSKGWEARYTCVREMELSQYAFKRLPTHEAREILYWYLESGYLLVFHKQGEVRNYELVNFTVAYGGDTDWGAFKVSLGKS